MKNKSNIYNIVTVAILITIIIVRLFLTDIDNWINAINFAGIIIACFSLYCDTFQECKNYKKINMFTGISILVFCVFVIIEVLIVIEIISVSNLGNDVITLCTLLLSLPANLYKKILAELLK